MDKKTVDTIIVELDKNAREKGSKIDNEQFLSGLLRKYGISDEQWEYILKEWNKRMDKELLLMKLKRFVSQIPFLIIKAYAIIFITYALITSFQLPEEILRNLDVREGWYYIGNTINTLLVIFGLFLISLDAKERKKKD